MYNQKRLYSGSGNAAKRVAVKSRYAIYTCYAAILSKAEAGHCRTELHSFSGDRSSGDSRYNDVQLVAGCTNRYLFRKWLVFCKVFQ